MSLDNAGSKWTPAEDDRLQWELRHGSTIAEIARAHGRTETAIGCRIAKLIGINKPETREDNKVKRTTEQLYIEYARVIKLCEGTEVKPWACVKLCGDNTWHTHPHFNQNPEGYEFALGILEDKPVFVGDTVYHKETGIQRTILEGVELVGDFHENFAWEKPKPRTFNLNGEELPSPVEGNSSGHYFVLAGYHYYFERGSDKHKVFNAIKKLLDDARG